MSTAYLLPVGDGNYTSFTAVGAATDWQCVDDPVGSPDDATTYIKYEGLDTNQVRASVVLGAFAFGGIINSVTITTRVLMPGATSNGTIFPFLRIGGADYDGDAQTFLKDASPWREYSQAWAVNPSTSAAWTVSDLAALEAGVMAAKGTALASSYITQIYATVSYTPAVTYAINAGTTIPGIQANWPPRSIKRKNNDGSIEYQSYTVHTWELAQIDMDTFLALAALQGKVLTSLQTTDIEDPNLEATYTGAELVSVIGGQQVGRRVTGVRCTFRIDVS